MLLLGIPEALGDLDVFFFGRLFSRRGVDDDFPKLKISKTESHLVPSLLFGVMLKFDVELREGKLVSIFGVPL